MHLMPTWNESLWPVVGAETCVQYWAGSKQQIIHDGKGRDRIPRNEASYTLNVISWGNPPGSTLSSSFSSKDSQEFLCPCSTASFRVHLASDQPTICHRHLIIDWALKDWILRFFAAESLAYWLGKKRTWWPEEIISKKLRMRIIFSASCTLYMPNEYLVFGCLQNANLRFKI